MTPAFRVTMLWVVGATIFVLSALTPLSASYLDGQYIPANPDAFYHARRILDVIMAGQPVQQFDPKIHVPDGSWITWPWAFDWTMAHITSWFGPFANEAEANRVLMRIPVGVGALFVGTVLVLALQLGLSGILTALLVISAAALPVITLGFAVGNIDHHFAESLWTAFTICTGIWFFTRRDAIAPAIVLGAVLASAVGMHNSLFILQIPVALMFLLRWLQGEPLPSRRCCIAFAISLSLLTIAVCAPSEPWQKGFFEFYTLSWFHVYIAACTAGFCCLVGFLPRKSSTIWLVVVAAVLAALPIVGILGFAQRFMSGELESIRSINEVLSPYRLFADNGEETARIYSWLLLCSVPMVVFNAWVALKVRESHIQFFALAAALGLVLFQMQYRFHVFGELALLATPLLAIHLAQQRWPQQANRVAIFGCITFLTLMFPIHGHWAQRWTLGGHEGYREVSGVFPVLKQACAVRPGIVLADFNAGHWIRYHSDCNVIANPFLLTPQHTEKLIEARKLMSLTPERLLEAAQPIRYVLVFHQLQLIPGFFEPNLKSLLPRMVPLEGTLLGSLEGLPPQYHLMWSSTTPAGQTYARLFEIVR
jgi:hypothetical protein